ncbi:MAG TPA: methylated-DNA--[protein]-cysteine S-methyltransferase [Actinoplanes sp.]|nr:methylated-DNA--[protein]-cysteine S-methyltransferase [Actinoplanes sp.]
MLRYSTMDTPAGPFTIVVGPDDAVRASGFTADVAELTELIHPRLHDDLQRVDDVGPAQAAVTSYFDGDLTAIDDVRVDQRTGGSFRAHAWEVMRDIKPGEPATYSGFAALAGRPTAIRAAAAACAQNAAALFVPCHRVVGTDGKLHGYRWGLDVKTALLEHEQGRSIAA